VSLSKPTSNPNRLAYHQPERLSKDEANCEGVTEYRAGGKR
jgi:hypothetical protein